MHAIMQPQVQHTRILMDHAVFHRHSSKSCSSSSEVTWVFPKITLLFICYVWLRYDFILSYNVHTVLRYTMQFISSEQHYVLLAACGENLMPQIMAWVSVLDIHACNSYTNLAYHCTPDWREGLYSNWRLFQSRERVLSSGSLSGSMEGVSGCRR